MPIKDYSNEIGKVFNGVILISVDDFVVKGKRRECIAQCTKCGEYKTFKLYKVLSDVYKSCGCVSKKGRKLNFTDYDTMVGKIIDDREILEHNKTDRVFKTKCIHCGKEEAKDRNKVARSDYGKCTCQLLHNMSGTKVYRIWKNMKQRCTNPNNQDYHNYGGRGIMVCDRWFNSFEAFYSDMGDIPSDDYQIDRINNDGNYEPSNCRWVSPLVNANNKRPALKNPNGYVGVHKSKNGYYAKFLYYGKLYQISYFETAKEAFEEKESLKNLVINSKI